MIEVKGMSVELDDAKWFKSSFSGPNCDNCVEVAFVGQATAVRDSKNPDGPALLFTPDEWSAFLEGALHGEFNRS